MNTKVVELASRRERWHSAYTVAGLQISVSCHGRLYIQLDGKDIFLDLTDSVALMGQVSEKYEKIVDL
jgi:hypothetical protein